MNYQVCEPLTSEEFAALKADIAERGVMVPVEVDENGDTLDGHHRILAWAELRAEGIDVPDYPVIVRKGMSEAEKRNHARKLNALRRQMTKEQRDRLIVAMRQDGMSYRQIGDAVGIDAATAHRTVANATVDQPATITGRDGKERPATKPRRPQPAPVRYADVDDDGWGIRHKLQRRLTVAENSKIEWTDHTFNPWLGCTKVSDGCKHCYAETLMDKRYGRVKWGPQGTRQRTSAANWRKPLAWNRKAAAEGRRYRVFCASLADVFEDRPELAPWRADLFHLIQQTPHLDWLLLTKRPENVNDMVPGQWRNVNRWPGNVWIGASVEDQAAADERIPHLLHVPARVRFLSMEPLLGAVDLWAETRIADDPAIPYISVDWVIVGGESGPRARPMEPGWVRSIRDQCVAAGVPFFFKQWGEWAPMAVEENPNFVNGLAARYPNGGRIAPGPGSHWFNGHTIAMKIGKANAGRILDGQEWSQFPQMQVTS